VRTSESRMMNRISTSALNLPLALLGAIGLGASASLWADDHDDEASKAPQEVFQTELVFPQEKGETQLTLIPQFNDGDEADVRQLGVVMEYGITDQWQVEAG